MKNCPNCGMELSDEVQQCTLCGYTFDEQEQIKGNDELNVIESSVTNTPEPKESVPNKASIPVIVIGIVCLVLLIVVFVLGYLVFSKNGNETTNKGVTVDSSSFEKTTVTTTTSPTSTTTTKATTTPTTSTKATTTTTAKATTKVTQPDLSLYSGTYTLKDGQDTHTLKIIIDDSNYCSWTYSLLLPMHFISMHDGSHIDSNTIDFHNVVDDYGESNYGYITFINNKSVRININGISYTLYK